MRGCQSRVTHTLILSPIKSFSFSIVKVCLILVKSVKSDGISNSPKIHNITFLPLYIHFFDNQYVAKTPAVRVSRLSLFRVM